MLLLLLFTIYFWPETPATLPVTHHTYVAVIGTMKSTRIERSDGDRHVILCADAACITGECILSSGGLRVAPWYAAK